MNQTLRFLLAATLATGLTAARPAYAQNNRVQRINLGYYLAFGRMATTSEVKYWLGRSDATNWTVSQFVDNHAAWFASSQGFVELESTIFRATAAAWGNYDMYNLRSKNWTRYSKNRGTTWKTYVELVKLLTDEMDRDKTFKEKIIRQSYADVNLKPSSSDIWGWVNGWGNGKSYLQIIAEHLSWKARQAGKGTPGLAGSPSSVISEALRVRSAGIVAMGGGNIVAMGGGNLWSSNFANVGLISSGGASLVQW